MIDRLSIQAAKLYAYVMEIIKNLIHKDISEFELIAKIEMAHELGVRLLNNMNFALEELKNEEINDYDVQCITIAMKIYNRVHVLHKSVELIAKSDEETDVYKFIRERFEENIIAPEFSEHNQV